MNASLKSSLLALAVAAAVLGGYQPVTGSQLDANRPEKVTPSLTALPEQRSSMTVPISVSLSSIRAELDEVISRRWTIPAERFSWGPRFLGGQFKVFGHLTARNVEVRGADNRLTVSATYSGTIKIRHRGRGPFGYTRWTIPATFGVRGSARVSSDIRINENWLFETSGLSVNVNIRDIDPGFEDHGLANLWNEYIEESVEDELTDGVRRTISEGNFVRPHARRWWNRFCGSFRIENDLLPPESQLRVEVKPLSVRVAQPQVSTTDVRLQLGIDFAMRVVDNQTSPRCPFPTRLVLVDPAPASISLMLPVDIRYATLNGTLSQLLEPLNKALEKEIENTGAAQYLSGTIEALRLGPYGSGLLLEADINVRVVGCTSSFCESQGTLYFAVQPILKTNTQNIVMRKVTIDIDSQNKLFAALGGTLAKPWLRELEANLEGQSIDLTPTLEQLRGEANETLVSLGDHVSNQGAHEVRSSVENLRLTDLDIGPEYLRLIAMATGRVDVVVR